MVSPTWLTWVCISSGSWWWTGNRGMLQSMGVQRVRHDWETELKWMKIMATSFKRSCACTIAFSVAILLLKMKEKATFWHIMLYYFKKGWNATEKKKKCALYAEGAVTDLIETLYVSKWFEKFCPGDFSLNNNPWWGTPVEDESDQVKTLIEKNQHCTIWEIANILEISTSSMVNHLLSLVMLSILLFGFHVS